MKEMVENSSEVTNNVENRSEIDGRKFIENVE